MATCAKTFDVDVSTGRPAASNEAYYHGETIEFRAVRGRSVVTNIEYGCIYYQTNGMGDAWWKTDGLTFEPTNDVGAASYRFFMEGRESAGADHRAARDWHANGLLRLLPSPGFTPNEIELPVARLDFANVDVLNPPYYSKAETEAKIVELADDLADISSRIDAASGPQRYVLSATPDYYYSGDASIPAGYYYRAVTGGGYCRYAARVPIPQGSVVLSGAADDPIIAKFGSEIPIDHNWITIETLSGLETDGQYNIADIVFSPDTSLGLTVLFHCNILNPVPEFADVSFTPASGSITFVHGGVQHTCTIASHSSLACTYTDAAYDMQSGTWSTGTYTLSASFIQSSATDWGVGTFGGAELATKDDLNPEIAKVLGIRTGLDGEYGSGMGYKVYNFASERRYWELHVPNLAVSCPRNTSTSSRTFSSSSGHYFSTPSLNYPLCATDRFAVGASLTETADAFGTDGCAQAMWRVWIIPANTNNIDGPCTYEITATNRVSAGFLGIAATGGIGPSEYINFAHTNSAGRAINYTLSNFRATNLSGTRNSRQIGFTYDVLAVSGGYTCSYTASHTVTITTSTTVNGVVTLPSSLIISDKTHHLMYDDGLKCTWRLEATNGVFYVRKVSGKDYRKEDVE